MKVKKTLKSLISSFLEMPSSMISKGSIYGTLGEASFMDCLPSCSMDSRKDSEKTDLNLSFSMVAFFLLAFSSFPLIFSGATPCVSLCGAVVECRTLN